jgi:hypothetical protein
MQEKNELVMQQDGSIALVKNGVPCFCPKQAIAWGQNKVSGEPFPIKQPCNNACPAFKIRNNNSQTMVDITCSGIAVPYIISEIKNEEEKPKLTII